jgi:glycosidase
MTGVDWFKNAIIYHILIDRFAGFESTNNWHKPEFLGGNIRGIIEKIPYLKQLGINTLWISPFYKTSSYHGYHITDFFQIDSHFGTNDDLIELIETVHKYDMKIIADFVPNHCSNQHPFFIEAQQDKNSYYRKWFYFTNWPDRYQCFLSVKQLPKINLNHHDARDYIINAAKHWLNLGFDGYRLDHVIGPSHSFWKKFNIEIKNMFPDIILIGEAWMKGVKFNELKTININNKFFKWIFGESSDFLLKEYPKELDGVLDFRFQELIKDYIAYDNLSEKEFYRKLKQHYSKYFDNYYLPIFLDNHDMNRFLFECKNNKEKLKQAIKIQFSIDQPIIIYYGTEIGMTQNKSIWDFSTHGDIQARQPMNWKKQDNELLIFYKKLIKKRRKSKNC